jgi:hypothetical protein
MGEPGLIRKADIDRHLLQVGEGKPMLVQIRTDLENLLFAQIGNHIDRVQLGDLGKRTLLPAAADDVAGIDQVLADDAVEGCPDPV